MPRNNPAAPVVEIELDRVRHMRLDFNALADFEDATGKSAFDAKTFSTLRGADLRALLWASMVHEDPTLSMEQVGAMIHFGNIEYVTERVGALMGGAMPKSDGNGEANKDTPLTG